MVVEDVTDILPETLSKPETQASNFISKGQPYLLKRKRSILIVDNVGIPRDGRGDERSSYCCSIYGSYFGKVGLAPWKAG